MRKIAVLIVGATIAVGSFGIAGADHAECNGTITELDTPAGLFYVDDRGIDVGGIWLYQEANDEAGLQSGGTSATLGEEDTCDGTHEGGAPDLLIL